jgi:hypothetical protein
MLKKYRITRIGKRDSWFEDAVDIEGKEVLAESDDVGILYDGALSGDIVFSIVLKSDSNIFCGSSAGIFHEAYVKEI